MKSIKRENGLFSLCYMAEEKVIPNQFARNLLIIYLASYVTHVLTLKSTSLLGFNFEINSTIFILLNGFLGLIILQSILFLIIGKQFYLAAQIKIFRYSLMEQGVNFIIKETINPTIFSATTSVILFIFYISVNLIIVRCITFENYQEKTLISLNFSFSFYFFLFNFLFELYDNTNHHALKSVLISCLLFSLYKVIENNSKICSEKWQTLFFSIVVKFTLVVSMYLLIEHVLSKDLNTYLFYFILLSIYIIVGIFLDQKEKILKNKELEQSIDATTFLLRIQQISFDIDQVLDGSKKFDETQLKAYLSRHELTCKLPNCPLFGEEAKAQLKSLQQTKSIKNSVKKLKKHLQLHFEERFIMNKQDTTLCFGYLSYLIFYTSHKRKAFELFNNMNKENYTLDLSYHLFSLKNKLDALQDEQSIISKTASNFLYQTYNQYSSNILQIFRKICSILLQDKIDFSLLTSMTHQMSHERHQLDKFIEKVFLIETFGAYKILTLYGRYCKELFQENQKAQYIEKHLQNLIEKLDHKKEVEFLSNRSEVGLVAISLSENSLGNIFSINQYAQSIFGFEGKDIIGRSVNNIMPSTFATYHDSLLMVFLKNRTKKVNGDERVLIGKNKNGLIFPVMLRLQRVIVSSDELVFVANIRKYKTRQSPIMFIANLQGEVVDYSAGFQYYFMKKNKHYRFNIFQIAPNFGDVAIDGKSNFSISNQFRPGSIVSVDFKVVPLAFFGNLEAYYLFGTKTMEVSRQATKSLPITQAFTDLILQQRLRCHYNSFVADNSQHAFAIETAPTLIDPDLRKTKQLTIPFIHMDSFSKLIQVTGEGEKQYHKNIKTIRLVKKHFEPVEIVEQNSLEEFEEDQKDFFISKKKALSVDEIHNSNSNLAVAQKIILIITVAMIIFNLCTFSIVARVNQNKNASMNTEIEQYEVKEYMSDFILFSSFKQLGYNQSIYLSEFTKIQNRAVSSLEATQIAEELKQCYFRIIYSQQTWSKVAYLFSQPFITSTISRAHQNLWFINITFIALFVALLFAYIYLFKEKIFAVYSYFLSLDESLILSFISKCEGLNKVALGQDSALNSGSNEKLIQSNEQNDPTFIKKHKSFNRSSRKHDIVYIIQILASSIILATIITVMIAQSNVIERRIDAASLISIKLSQIKSESSVFLLSSYLLNSGSSITLNSNFNLFLQQIPSQITDYAMFEGNSSLKASFDVFMAGDICNNSQFSGLNLSICVNIANKISTHGAISALDFIHTQVLGLNAAADKQNALETLSGLNLLHHYIVQSAITRMVDILSQIKLSYESSFFGLYSVLGMSIVVVAILQYLFLRAIPFKNMKNEIKMVFHLIEVFESIKKSRLPPAKPK